MKIYIFNEHYPSPFKPYFTTQFEQFLKDKHKLRIFALGHHPGQIESKVINLGLDKITSYLPTTLHSLPRFFYKSIISFLRNPEKRIPAALKVTVPNLSFKRNITNIIRMLQLPLSPPDLCLVHNLLTMRSLIFLRNLYPSTPVALYYHGGEVAGVKNISYHEAAGIFKAADFVFTNTQSSKEHAISRGCPKEKISIIPVGFNIEEFNPEEQREYRRGGVLRLLSVGRMSEEKGFIYALEGLNRLMAQGFFDWSYKIIGGGPLEKQLQSFTGKNNLSEKVKFPGIVSRETLFSELMQADALLLPSIIVGTWQENQACVVQEAMLMKTIVITTSTGGVPESIAPQMVRFSIPPKNPSAIAQSIKQLFSLDQSQWQLLGKACRNFAITHYDISRLNKQLIETVSSQSTISFP